MRDFNDWLGYIIKRSGPEELPLQPTSRSEGDKIPSVSLQLAL